MEAHCAQSDERTHLLSTVVGPDSTRSNSSLDDITTPLPPPPPVPFRFAPLFSMLLMCLIKPMCYDLVLPFINQMIVENGIVDDPEKVGPYSGFIESAFAAMNIIALLPWTFMSDRAGRKPVVLIGTIGMALSIAAFGVSKSYLTMVLTMCISGYLAGTRATMKVMLAELYPVKSHRITAFSANQIAFRAGQMSGDSLGGLLSHPERRMDLFDNAFWRKFPFSLPCFVASAFSILTAIYGFFTLEETLPSRRDSQTVKGADIHGVSELEDGVPFTVDPSLKQQRSIYSAMTPHVRSVILSTFGMVISAESIFALYPLFAFTPISSGGLGLREAQIGAHMAMRSSLNIVAMCLAAPIQHYLGPLRTYQLGMAFWPVSVVMLPIMNDLAKSENSGYGTFAFNFALGVLLLSWSTGSLVWPSSQILVIESPSSPEDLAIVNGVQQMVQWLAMTIAPTFVSSLFTFSIKSGLLSGNLIYAILLGIGCWGTIHCLTLRDNDRGLTIEEDS